MDIIHPRLGLLLCLLFFLCAGATDSKNLHTPSHEEPTTPTQHILPRAMHAPRSGRQENGTISGGAFARRLLSPGVLEELRSVLNPVVNGSMADARSNITGLFKGTWRSLFQGHLPHAFVQSEGHLYIELAVRPTSIADRQLVKGGILIRDGAYSTDRDQRLGLHGIYYPERGYLTALAFSSSEGVSIPVAENMILAKNMSALDDLFAPLLVEEKRTRNTGTGRRDRLSIRKERCFLKIILRTLPPIPPDAEDAKDREDGLVLASNMARLSGAIWSHNCASLLAFNASALLESFFSKAINYTLMVTFVSFLQVLLLIRQMDYTNTQAGAAKVSLLTVAGQAIMDSYYCLFHMKNGIMVEPLFNAFATAAFFEFVIFSIFEIRYVLVIWKAQRPNITGDTFNASFRRELGVLYLGFYGSLLVGSFVVVAMPSLIHTLVFLLFSYWIPQIVNNAISDTRKPLHPHYIIGMSITRLAIPLYFYACPYNFAHIEPRPLIASCLTVYVVIQATLLLLQHRYGSRCFLLARWLPEKYNYYRPLLRSNVNLEDTDCVICMSALSSRPSERMVTPCDHVFHPHCLQQWMDIKMECPTCRAPLPPV